MMVLCEDGANIFIDQYGATGLAWISAFSIAVIGAIPALLMLKKR